MVVDRAELLELLEEVYEHGPDVGVGGLVRCFWCHADRGERHVDTCTWLRAAILTDNGEAASLRAVGDGDDEWADRVDGDLPAPATPRRRTARPRPPLTVPSEGRATDADAPPEFDAAAAEVLAQFERDVAQLGAPQGDTLDLLRDVADRIARDDALNLLGDEDPLVPVLVVED